MEDDYALEGDYYRTRPTNLSPIIQLAQTNEKKV